MVQLVICNNFCFVCERVGVFFAEVVALVHLYTPRFLLTLTIAHISESTPEGSQRKFWSCDRTVTKLYMTVSSIFRSFIRKCSQLTD